MSDYRCPECGTALHVHPEIARLRADVASEAIALIAAERRRHQSVEGWTPDHDDTHVNGEIGWAAACYAAPGPCFRGPIHEQIYTAWPWEPKWKKHKDDRVRQLVIAGALIVAEIERLKRKAAWTVCPECGGEGVVAIESDSLLSAGTRMLAKCRACDGRKITAALADTADTKGAQP